MKAKTFENLIRKVVREEIDYALRREIKSLKEDLREEIVIEEQPKTIFPPKKPLKEDIIGSKPINRKSIQRQTFTKNNALNDLLNETAMGDTNLESGHAPISMEAPSTLSGVGNIPAEAIPEAVANAVNRDYSGLMEAINKKKQK